MRRRRGRGRAGPHVQPRAGADRERSRDYARVYRHFDAIAPAASAALQALDLGDAARYREILEPTVPLSRHIFQAPTYHYKTSIVFLAYLNGHQRHFRMVGGQEAMRSVVHLAELFVLADRAHLFSDPELASDRMRHVLALAGID